MSALIAGVFVIATEFDANPFSAGDKKLSAAATVLTTGSIPVSDDASGTNGSPTAVSDTVVSGGFRLCNKTANRVGVAIGYKNTDGWTTEGWWNMPTEACKMLLAGPLSSRYYYVYAVDYDRGGEWGGPNFMCTNQKEFTINNVDDCVNRGFERTGFFEIDTGQQQSWTVQLTEPSQPGIGGR